MPPFASDAGRQPGGHSIIAGLMGQRAVLAWLCLYLGLVSSAVPAWAEGKALAAWRAEIKRTRILAENDVPRAYADAQRLLATLPGDAVPTDKIGALNLLARTEIYFSQTGQAARTIQLATDLAVQYADTVGQVEADLNLGLNAINQANIPALVSATTNSLTLLDGINRPELLSEAMLRAAMMYRRIGQFDESVTMAMQGMEIARRSQNPLALTFAEQGLGISFEQSGHLVEAQAHFLAMRAQAQAAQSKLLEAHALVNLGNVAAHLGEAKRAKR